jgi:hypothetical protein
MSDIIELRQIGDIGDSHVSCGFQTISVQTIMEFFHRNVFVICHALIYLECVYIFVARKRKNIFLNGLQ